MGRRVRVKVAVAVGAALFAAGCTGGGSRGGKAAGGFSIEALASSMKAARTAHVHITYLEPTGKSSGSSSPTSTARKLAVTMTGDLDLDLTHDTGELHEHLPVSKKSPIAGQVEIFASDSVYVTFDPVALSIPPRVAAGKHWLAYPNAGSSRAASIGANPYAVLTNLRQRGVTVKDLGATHVDGQPVHHYRAVETRAAPAIPGFHAFRVVDDLYIDARDRLVRLVSVSSYGVKSARDVTIQADYSKYGAPLHIAVPPASDVVEYRNGVTPTPRLRGPWAQVATGTGPGYSWKLFRAPADLDRVCWSFETAPPWTLPVQSRIGAESGAQIAAGTKPPRHAGHDASCTMAGDWQSPLEAIAVGRIGLHTVVAAVTHHDVVSVRSLDNGEFLLPPGLAAPGSPLPNNQSHAVPIDPRFGGFVDTRSKTQSAFLLRMRDGTKQTCPLSFLEYFTFGGAGQCNLSDKLTAASNSATLIKP